MKRSGGRSMPKSRRLKRGQERTTHCLSDWHTPGNRASLKQQDRLVAFYMGGVLPEQPDPTAFQKVLDIGCGSGCWVIDVALMYPTMSLIGIDIDGYLIDAAHADAEEAQISERVSFQTMDALKRLEFPDASFDLVNERFGGGFLRTWDWPNFVHEIVRVTRPGGVIRLTELQITKESSSAAFVELSRMVVKALFHAGHFFEEEPTGLTAHLEDLLKSQGCRQIQTKMTTVVIAATTEQGRTMCDNLISHFARTRFFAQKWSSFDLKEYDRLYQQLLNDIQQQEDFFFHQQFFTIWGRRGESLA